MSNVENHLPNQDIRTVDTRHETDTKIVRRAEEAAEERFGEVRIDDEPEDRKAPTSSEFVTSQVSNNLTFYILCYSILNYFTIFFGNFDNYVCLKTEFCHYRFKCDQGLRSK